MGEMRFVKGSQFQLTGQVFLGGLPMDCTGWSMSFTVSDETGVKIYASMPATWLDQENGIYQIATSAPLTATWEEGRTRFDSTTTDPDGVIRKAEPDYFYIVGAP